MTSMRWAPCSTKCSPVARRTKAAPEPILKLRPKLTPGLIKVVEGATAREHRDRYANMADVLADLARIEKGQPPLGPHTTFSLRRFEGTRSHLTKAVAGSLAALAFVWLGYSVWPTEFTLRVKPDKPDSLSPEVRNWANAKTGDWDGDSEPDILQMVGDTLYVVSSQGHQLDPLRLAKPSASGFVLGMAADITGDGKDEAFVSWNSETNACLMAFNQRGSPIREFAFASSLNVHPQWGTNRTKLEPFRLADLEGDSKKELLAAVTSSWALHPRGICCFDVTTGELKWFFETATFVMEIELCDLDGDGQLEVIVGSNSPGNGSSLPDGTDDQHAYLYALSAKGELIWRRELSWLIRLFVFFARRLYWH